MTVLVSKDHSGIPGAVSSYQSAASFKNK